MRESGSIILLSNRYKQISNVSKSAEELVSPKERELKKDMSCDAVEKFEDYDNSENSFPK